MEQTNKQLEITKKVVMIATIIGTIITSLYLILMLLGVTLFKENQYSILLTFGGIAVGGFFAINSLNLVSKNKIIGWVSFGLIAVSVLLIIILGWTSLSILTNITISFALLSIVFNIIVSLVLSLGKKYLPIQIVFYILLFALDIITTLKVFNAIPKGNGYGTTWFLILTIIDIVGLVVLNVLSRKQINATNENMVTISKEEYESLKEKAQKYDELNKNN